MLTKPLTMIEPNEALQRVLENTPPPEPINVPIADALGRVLAQDIKADQDYPPYNRAMMDGYAARLTDAGQQTKIIGEVPAEKPCDIELLDGQCVSIMTGGLCPPGAQVVVPIEHTTLMGEQVLLPQELKPNKHIAPRGSECPKDHIVLSTGETISPLAIADLATFGITTVSIYKRPTVAILPTGSELVPPDQTPGPGQIRDSNSSMLAAAIMALGLNPPIMLTAPDSIEALTQTITQQLNAADILILTGGVSAGKYDLVPQVLQNLGAQIIFHKVKQKPEKPILFARRENKLIFALPGNPLSALIGFTRYVSAAIRQFSGQTPTLPDAHGTLTAPIDNRGHQIRFVFAKATPAPDAWQILPLPGQGSADIYATAPANCTITLPPETDYPAGANINFQWTGPNP
jgi:molybdenum cofactor synthesis domain-containing protein